MWSPTTERNPDTYLPFTHYRADPGASVEGWVVAPSGFPYVDIAAESPEHLWLGPTVQNMAVVRWRSSFAGHVSFWGQFYPHSDAGDGIKWYIQHQHGSVVTTLAEGTLNSGGPEYAKKATFGFSSLAVTEDDYLYFVVDAGPTDAFDNTIFTVTLIGPHARD